MISKNEHMINALTQRLEELRQGKFGALEELSYREILLQICDITKNYTTDRRELLNFMGLSELSAADFKTIAAMDYEDNSNEQ